MGTDYFASMLHDRTGVLDKALGDPRVRNLARSLNLDLQDRATLSGLLNMTQQHADRSAAMQAESEKALSPTQQQYARCAIRAYQKMVAMTRASPDTVGS